MAQHSLYRRYRPRRFDEVRGQNHVTTALINAVAGGTEVHAYLLSGPRGTGKTSTARILAKALNCENLKDGEPCCECDSCLAMEAGSSFDLFELDAASNNGVDAIRELVDRAAVGSPGRTKVYILDEVHMLTTAASNALLKTLEEPPDHVCFVLATTDPQKVLPTIQSRTQHFRFQLLSAAELDSYVRWVVEDAGLEVTNEEIEYVVKAGRGSARDTLTALDQVVAAGGVAQRVQPVDVLFESIAQRSSGKAIAAVAESIEQGSDPRVLGEAFLASVRNAFLVSMNVDVDHLLDSEVTQARDWADQLGAKRLTMAMEAVGEALVEMRQAADPRIPLEVALIRLSGMDSPAGESSQGVKADPSPATGSAAEDDSGALDDQLAALQRQLGVLSRKVEALESSPRGGGSRSAPPTPPKRRKPREESETSSPSPQTGSTTQSESTQTSESPEAATVLEARGDASAPDASAGSKGQTGGAPDTSRMVPKPSTGAAAQPSSAADSPSGASKPDRDAVVMAFGDEVVGRLGGIARAIFSNGRFVSVDDSGAVVALENEHTVKQAQKHVADVEKLLAEHFSQRISIRLVTEAEASKSGSPPQASSTTQADERTHGARPVDTPKARRPPPPVPTKSSGGVQPEPQAPSSASEDSPAVAGTAEVDEVGEVGDVHSLQDADDVTDTAVSRIIDAFPGSELLEGSEAGDEKGTR